MGDEACGFGNFRPATLTITNFFKQVGGGWQGQDFVGVAQHGLGSRSLLGCSQTCMGWGFSLIDRQKICLAALCRGIAVGGVGLSPCGGGACGR